MLFQFNDNGRVSIRCGSFIMNGSLNKLEGSLYEAVGFMREVVREMPEYNEIKRKLRTGIVLSGTLQVTEYGLYYDKDWNEVDPSVNARFGQFGSLFIAQATRTESVSVWECIALRFLLRVPRHIRDGFWHEAVEGISDWVKTHAMSPLVPKPILEKVYEELHGVDTLPTQVGGLAIKQIGFDQWLGLSDEEVPGTYPIQLYNGSGATFLMVKDERE